MNVLHRFLFGLLSVFSLLPLLASGPALAQSGGANAPPRVDGFDIEQVQQLTPGTDLNFTLWGTPGGVATLRINGAKHKLVLEESQAGVYEGIYTISARDRIKADSRIDANLRLGNQVASAVLDEPILAGTPARDSRSGTEPRVERFEVQPAPLIAPGNEIGFTLRGTPGGQATVVIGGARGKFFLPEERSGEYSGSYTIRNSDRITADSPVIATLRVGERATNATLGHALVAAAHAPPVRSPPAASACAHCGTVSAIHTVEVKGDGSYLGPVAGGVVGALIGSQIGGGDGRRAAQIVGAVGGAFAGREIERNSKKTTHYEVVVQLRNGGRQTLSYASEPAFRVGDPVRIVNGALVSDR